MCFSCDVFVLAVYEICMHVCIYVKTLNFLDPDFAFESMLCGHQLLQQQSLQALYLVVIKHIKHTEISIYLSIYLLSLYLYSSVHLCGCEVIR